MGSIHVCESLEDGRLDIHLDIQDGIDEPLHIETSRHGVPSVEAAALDPNKALASTATSVSQELLLLSWLIVLQRTREERQITYEWAYKTIESKNKADDEAVATFSADELLPGLDCTVEHGSAVISRHITSSSPRPTSAGPVSLLLSTGPLSTAAASKEPLLHVEVNLEDGCPMIRPTWFNETMFPLTVTWHVESLADTVKLCIANPEACIRSLLGPTKHDLDAIWSWTHELPPSNDFCMHDVISEQAQRHPDKEAISSWDGSLTYGQVDRYSTYMAHLLQKELGVQLHDFVPLCFEKSKWTIVAVLAVMKAGATMVMMDPTLPLARLQNMKEQVSAKAMVSSVAQHGLAKAILRDGKILVVQEENFAAIPDSQEALPQVPASALMYVIFTSGSTGTPKGVKISHQTYSSSAIPRARAVGYTEESRVLDFAAYAFDVSIDSMLLTLANGGCLCIPSDEDRLNDINGAMRTMRVNYAGITPSVARILDLDLIASLSGLGLGGEAASARDVNLWGQLTRIIIGYGPCECTIGCTVNSSAAKGRDYISIGPGNGAAIWIVDPNDHQTLLPVGAVGELLVDGPIVGQGYLNDPEKTAAAFIEDPSWLTAGHGKYPGRRGRLYKTGDLGKYDPDGSGEIVFVGRKDTQVKLRGQRVELGEIESHLRARLPQDTNVIAEVIVPQGSAQGQPTLVAFIAPQLTAHGKDSNLEHAPLHPELASALSKAAAEISDALPRYMVPTAYIPVNKIPTLISGKTDRKKLRQFGATTDLRQLTADQVASVDDATTPESHERPLPEMEQRLREAWALTLRLDAANIRLNDNFFALGGDSLAAMRLSSVCRDQGFDLSVISTFGNPTLAAMAAVVVNLETSEAASKAGSERSAFSLIGEPAQSTIEESSQVCGTQPANIEDIYPCTPTQESLFTFSLKSTEAYIAQRVAYIPHHIAIDDWKHAWETVVATAPVLRSRLVHLEGHSGLSQVVLRQRIQWRHVHTELAQFLEEDRNNKMSFGQPLARYAVVEPPSTPDKRYMVWTLHHAVYDGWSEPLVLEKVRDALAQAQTATLSPRSRTMGDFVKYVRDTDEAAMQDFWRGELQGAVGPQFPRVPSRDFFPTPDTILDRRIPFSALTIAGMPFTLATLIRGAWALVASQYSGNDDVVFGETLTGRDVPLPGVETIVGPLIATVPIRVRVDRAADVASYLHAIQQGTLARTPYQHMGIQNIRKVSRDAQYACEAPTGLVIQPAPEHGAGQELGFVLGDVVREAIHFNPYPLMLACGIERDGFRVCASFDSSLVGVLQMERILAQLETACAELTKDLGRRLGEVPSLPAAELNQIWQWNRGPPLVLDVSTGRLRTDSVVVKPGSVYQPRAVVPWVCDLRNPSLLAPIGCLGELWLEGAVFAGDGVVESPAWLVAGASDHVGRTGKVQPTGDIVKLQEDGTLVFIGHKNINPSTQGHAADLNELEAHFKTYLNSDIRAAAAISQSQGVPKQELVVFVERPLGCGSKSSVDVLPAKHTIDVTDNLSLDLCAVVDVGLVSALKRLDKFVQNSLASHLVPSAYAVINKMPIQREQINRSLLQELASKIPSQVLEQLREGFRQAWKTNIPTQPTQATLAEDILRSGWATILGLGAHQIDVDDNFFRLGGDSVLAMKLASLLRGQGHGLTVADIFRHMRLGDAAKVLKLNQHGGSNAAESAGTAPQPLAKYQPFSMLGAEDKNRFVTEVVRPQLRDASWSVQDVYPVTDSQALDVRATIQTPRTSIQYTMLTFDAGAVDHEQLLKACSKLVQAHDILRTVFIEHDSTFYQVVLEDLEISVAMHQTEAANMEKFFKDLSLSHIESDAYRLGVPFLHLFLLENTAGQSSFIIGLSHAQYDGVSLPNLLHDLETLYDSKSRLSRPTPFSSYLLQTRRPDIQSKALAYWRNLLSGSSLSVLPDQTAAKTSKAIFRTIPVSTQITTPIQAVITTATLLTSAWALLLARRLRTPDVTFGGITSGRTLETFPEAEQVMGPCYQFTPVRVTFQTWWTATDLMGFVQRQSAESMAWDWVGFDRVAKECGWLGSSVRDSSEKNRALFFDSVVHHQDWENFDVMGFAGRECKVDILNPHGDAASPMKIVSFVKGGKMQVGVVGAEEDEELVESVLGELAAVVRQLASGEGCQMLDKDIFPAA
ncbi:nonribosomal siderophore peptide synthase Sid2 [Parathielavia hyrcaniae]|uniref:Nonribosomal siderophore peptide synthase Sid2 n=1 Tax=Parathielavia hyrcaniae TaxID=113614 RepID=A0AAN6PVW3_9PEZI|nr:nonribosomal siderophore peptide synthase Sid2 [Parathielavia hyrcaniae]